MNASFHTFRHKTHLEVGTGDRGEHGEEETADDEQADLPRGEEGHPQEAACVPVPPAMASDSVHR